MSAAPAPADAPKVATEGTDSLTWTDAQLAAASAESPHPALIYHPSRFARCCRQNSSIEGGRLRGAQTLVDMGTLDLAAGTAAHDGDCALIGYEVAAGDAGAAIGERLCVDYVTLLVNKAWAGRATQPREVPTLVPGAL